MQGCAVGRSGETMESRRQADGCCGPEPVRDGCSYGTGGGGPGRSTAGPLWANGGGSASGPFQPSGLLDVLGVAAVVLDAEGRIVLWSPQAEELFGYSAQEALGQYAGRLLVHEGDLGTVLKLFDEAMAIGRSWAGAFPVRHKDGGTRLVEFRNMRLLDDRGDLYALGIASDKATVRRVERDLALSMRVVSQSPIGLAVLDTDLRYVSVNPALERINGIPAEEHLGRSVREVLPFLDVDSIESAVRQVLHTGEPLIDQPAVGRTPGRSRTTGWRKPPELSWAWPSR